MADERIERLLNRFGQTIEDLPKADNVEYAYTTNHHEKAKRAASKFGDYLQDWYTIDYVKYHVLNDYICHLCDVIDRMEIALETASRWMPCYLCKNASECSKKGMEDLHCVRPCDEKTINDYMLHDQ